MAAEDRFYYTYIMFFLSEMEGIRVYVLSTELKGRFPMIWTTVDTEKNVCTI